MEGCDLRIGVYESFDTLCIYLESDAFGSGLERNYWVKYRIAILNQKYPERTEWKEAAICTKTWNNSVLQFMKVNKSRRERVVAVAAVSIWCNGWSLPVR